MVTREQDTLADLLLLSHATRRVLQDEVLAHFKASGLNTVRMGVLRLLARRGKQSVNLLARFLGLSKAAASQNIDQLVRRGLASRHTDPEDRRTTWVEITPEGRGILGRAEHQQLQAFRKFLAHVPADLRTFVCDRLSEIAAALVDLSAAADETCLQCCAFRSARCLRHPQAKGWSCAALQKAMPSVLKKAHGDLFDA